MIAPIGYVWCPTDVGPPSPSDGWILGDAFTGEDGAFYPVSKQPDPKFVDYRRDDTRLYIHKPDIWNCNYVVLTRNCPSLIRRTLSPNNVGRSIDLGESKSLELRAYGVQFLPSMPNDGIARAFIGWIEIDHGFLGRAGIPLLFACFLAFIYGSFLLYSAAYETEMFFFWSNVIGGSLCWIMIFIPFFVYSQYRHKAIE